jgi:hypothetical protein
MPAVNAATNSRPANGRRQAERRRFKNNDIIGNFHYLGRPPETGNA